MKTALSSSTGRRYRAIQLEFRDWLRMKRKKEQPGATGTRKLSNSEAVEGRDLRVSLDMAGRGSAVAVAMPAIRHWLVVHDFPDVTRHPAIALIRQGALRDAAARISRTRTSQQDREPFPVWAFAKWVHDGPRFS